MHSEILSLSQNMQANFSYTDRQKSSLLYFLQVLL
jgi:hypothetical protein